MAPQSINVDDQKSGVTIQAEDHTLTPLNGPNGPEEMKASGSAPSHSPSVMLGFIENHPLDIRPLSDLKGGQVVCAGLGNTFTRPIGYVIIWVQVDGVQGYDEDQIALIVLNLSSFVA